MRIGVPKETKDREDRVGLVPHGVIALCRAGHTVLVETQAGVGSGFDDEAYAKAGAEIVSREKAWSDVDLIVKVKEPNHVEVEFLEPGQVLFTYLHLAAAPELTTRLQAADVYAIAYETIQRPDGTCPVLAPMSEVAGRLATQIGATLLQKEHGGKGLLLGGVPGVPRGRVTILGAGTVGINALRIAHALGAQVDILDTNLERLAYVDDLYRGQLNTLHSNAANIERSVLACDLLIGAVYTYGRRAPILVEESHVAQMEAGSVVVDVAVDQGGCIQTIRPTTHSDPTYTLHDVVHYGVANMPGAVPRTSTLALTNVTLPYVLQIAEYGVEAAVRADPALARGANVWRGAIVCPGVAESLGIEAGSLDAILG